MALIDEVKVNIRVKSAAYDVAEIQTIIDACKIDLKIAGVNKIEEDDPLTKRAIILYSKANFGFSEDSEKFRQAYNSLRDSMASSGLYNTVVEPNV